MFVMNFLHIVSLGLIATILAAPTPQASSGPADVSITLIDATQHQWSITIPSTQTWTPTNVAESISRVHIENTGYVPCAFFGVDGTVVLSSPGDAKDLDIGPPQTIVGGVCGPFRAENNDY